MRLRMFQIDAFTGNVFAGNPAAVCPLETWLPVPLMQSIAAENNLSETAFFVAEGDRFALRWFTPTTEVELCGHATLASAFVIWTYLGGTGQLDFDTASGPLAVDREGDRIILNFPARPLTVVTTPPSALTEGLGLTPRDVLAYGAETGSGFFLAVYPREEDIRGLSPDMGALAQLRGMGVVATAQGDTSDFVSRCFAPTYGINEDPVTGSTHCFLAPFWAARLGRHQLHARQVSARGGELHCECAGDRVRIGGQAACYMEGWIDIPG